jgi:LmbE family N-acetylglucosaminyl deacetylase
MAPDPHDDPQRTIAQVDPPIGSVMAIAAHPDDIESWCGGTLARAVDAGAQVRLLLVTSGDKGSGDPSTVPAELAARREAEARAAARVLGLADVAFLRYLDGEVENTRELRRDLVAWIRAWRPDALFTHDPEHPNPPYLSHRDHRAVGRAVLDAVYPLARDPLCFPDLLANGLEPHKVREVWLFASEAAASYVDIGKTLEQKIAARLEHESQTVDREALIASWRKRATEIGEPAKLPATETFTILRID